MPLASSFEANPHWLPPQRRDTLEDIPGEDGWPVVGGTLKLVADPTGYVRRMHAKYGSVYRHRSFGGRNAVLLGADANELVLFDRDRIFSSEQGWGPMLNLLFPRGLMLMDFDKHRVHRRTLSVAFKPEPMRLYAESLNAGIARWVKAYAGRSFAFYPAIKALTLELAATSFLGLPFGPESARINQAFVDMVQATIGIIRLPLPHTAMGRGVAARRFLVDYFGKLVPERRAGNGEDMFSQICRATHDDGTHLSDGEIVDHMNFLMMAAHDTITSSATTLVMLLGRNPEWQVKLRDEMETLGVNDEDLPYDRLGDLVLTEYAFKEAMRLMPPVPSIPRRALKGFEFHGHHFPAGTFVGVNTHFVHADPAHWPDPEKFDPLRFTPEASRGRHKYAWVPFGGGPHMCLGLHFAYMQVKILMWHLLRAAEIELPSGSGAKWQAWPIPKPRDGLPLTLRSI
ncbi:MAG: cytochrome P450 [Sphingomonadaceae bacterium]|nr:cytochrome P450 [Sphingomonadaceae bacterium]